MMDITLGSDPEFFVQDRTTATPIPIVGMLGGEKGAPIELPGGGGVQEDNVMAEFNTVPTESATEFAFRVEETLDAVVEMLPDGIAPMRGTSEVLFPFEDLESEQAQTFGCSPDMDAYRGGRAPRVSTRRLRTERGEWRLAGGHIHIGYDKDRLPPSNVIAQFLDLVLTLPNLGYDNQPQRRQYYGAPGRYRDKEYGIEYRTLSNFWIWNPSMAASIAEAASGLIRVLSQSTAEAQHVYSTIPWHDVRRIIMRESQREARQLINYLHQEHAMLRGIDGFYPR